jgi:hypothetical protein
MSTVLIFVGLGGERTGPGREIRRDQKRMVSSITLFFMIAVNDEGDFGQSAGP